MALIADYSEAHPLIEQGLRQSTTFLSLVSLIALVIGALGVATAIQAHLQQKMDSIAIMKCLGAKSPQVLRIYVLQTVGLGLAGSLAGIALGSLVQMAFPIFLARYFQISIGAAFRSRFRAAGPAGGRADRPAVHHSAAARHSPYPPGADFPPRNGRAAARPAQVVEAAPRLRLISAVVILAVRRTPRRLAERKRAERASISPSPWPPGLASLALVAWLLLRGLRWFSRHLPRRAGPMVRQGIANLYRPGNHAGAAVMALGVGVMFTVTVWIVQRGLLQDIIRTAPPGMPNVYLLDVTAAESRRRVQTDLHAARCRRNAGNDRRGYGADSIDRRRAVRARKPARRRPPLLPAPSPYRPLP